METPLSSTSRRITRSQAAVLASSATSNTNTNTRKRTRKQDRSALTDITNDSPIIGLASKGLNDTPVSSVSKQRSRSRRRKKSPGSGEALLRGQVQNLLEKVEEQAVISKFCLQGSVPFRHAFKAAAFTSQACSLGPTPVIANTPQQVLDFDSLTSVSESPLEDHLTLPQVMSGIGDGKEQEEGDSQHEKDLMISRALFLEFSDKSDSTSVVAYQGANEVDSETLEKMASIDEDDASIWSTRDDGEGEDEVNQEGVEEDENDVVVDEEGLEEEGDVSFLDELCEGISNISVDDGEKKGPEFMGKHVRFVYNSDDELVEDEYDDSDSADVLRLKGLPTPKGKHFRFEDEDED